MFELPNLDKYLKYFNIFSFLYLKYVRGWKNITLATNYESTINIAEANDEGASWWDVFDGIMWICTIVAAMILTGYVRSVI